MARPSLGQQNWLRIVQVPQTYLVTIRRVVCPASQLESKHGRGNGGYGWDYGHGMGDKCG